jgi:hypothetical protein
MIILFILDLYFERAAVSASDRSEAALKTGRWYGDGDSGYRNVLCPAVLAPGGDIGKIMRENWGKIEA